VRLPLAILAVSALLVAGLPAAAPAATAAGPGCHTWTRSTVATGLGTLENLGFDGRGGLLLSSGTLGGPGKVLRRTPDGATTTLVANLTGPGGIVVAGSTAYFTTGNGITSGLLGSKDGTIESVDLDTGARATVATGLTMPNGMIAGPEGGFLVSRDLGSSTRMTEVRADGTRATYAPSATSTNGMAYDAARHRLYVDSTFNPTTTISVIDTLHPTARPRVITLPGLGPLNGADDLTLGADGYLYVALNVAGKVVRVDPDTGGVCTLTSGLPFPSSVRFGAGPGWDAESLYVTSFTGKVSRLTRS
jgi:glucose/arabinose dehydrogenase